VRECLRIPRTGASVIYVRDVRRLARAPLSIYNRNLFARRVGQLERHSSRYVRPSPLSLSLPLFLSFSILSEESREPLRIHEAWEEGGGGKKRRHGIGGQIDCSFIPRRFKADPARISRAGGAALRDL